MKKLILFIFITNFYYIVSKSDNFKISAEIEKKGNQNLLVINPKNLLKNNKQRKKQKKTQRKRRRRKRKLADAKKGTEEKKEAPYWWSNKIPAKEEAPGIFHNVVNALKNSWGRIKVPIFRGIAKPAEKVAQMRYQRVLERYKKWAKKRELFVRNLKDIQHFLIEHFEEGELRMKGVKAKIDLIFDDINENIATNAEKIKEISQKMELDE